MHRIQLEQVFDFLEEMLVLQGASARLLRLGRDRATEPQLTEYFARFARDVEIGMDRVITAIRDLGGNPEHRGQAARVQDERGEAALRLNVSLIPAPLHDLADVESAWYATLREDVQLTFLRSIGPFVREAHAQDVLAALARDIEEPLETREQWLEQTLHRLLLQRALRPLESRERRRAA